MPTVGIFPASGALASSTYNHLVNRIPKDNIILVSRYPEKLPDDVLDRRRAAYEDTPEELEAAFANIDVLFLVSYPSHVHEFRTEVQLPAISAAHKAGVKHIFYSSLAFALPENTTTKAEVMGAHLDSEEHLRSLSSMDPSFTWTSVREGLYHESYPIYTSFFDIRNPVEEILIPHDGSPPGISWANRDELGEATAILIAQYVKDPSTYTHKNEVVKLTGPTEWSLADTVKTLSAAIGKPVRIRQISVDEYVALPQVLSYFGFEERARTWATAWDAIRAGEAAYVSNTLEELLGRKPEPFDVTIQKLVGL
ncbi:hypothetical protein B0I35DRAFT_346564 [Stachybotrys elegans]|uniref:NmrA-like domain-containing protein n=1 Tax=Stachybotrys elegans TaxID=80388 RepID=A0A8K0T653_9HYPO|nr:hypothetical protein B0I35DRAFT_346564 [Stachybotrys elegans]